MLVITSAQSTFWRTPVLVPPTAADTPVSAMPSPRPSKSPQLPPPSKPRRTSRSLHGAHSEAHPGARGLRGGSASPSPPADEQRYAAYMCQPSSCVPVSSCMVPSELPAALDLPAHLALDVLRPIVRLYGLRGLLGLRLPQLVVGLHWVGPPAGSASGGRYSVRSQGPGAVRPGSRFERNGKWLLLCHDSRTDYWKV